MRFRLLLIILVVAVASCSRKPVQFTEYVNPFIGTGGHGHTYPGAAVPFGMVQLSPDTRLTGWDGCSAYHYSDDVVYGFSHTHLSGTGCSDYGDILLMPFTGEPTPFNGAEAGHEKGYASKFSHQKETASPGFYSVHLDDYNIGVRLTTTERVGVHEYNFPANEEAGVLIDLQHRDKVLDAFLEKSGDNEISGYRISRAWAHDQHIYFVIRFSESISKTGIWSDDKPLEALAAQGENIKGFVRFENPENNRITAKVGISAVSIEGAIKNLEAEAEGKGFDEILAEAETKWNDRLGKVAVQGGTKTEKVNFYTALYHSFLNPNLFMDVDGTFRGTDLKIHQASDYEYHTVFSLWDTYRATHPLFTILETEKTNHFIRTFLDMYKYGGKLPVWELAGNYTGCMIGYHSVPVIADAWVKGIRGYDEHLAMQAMVHSATIDHLGLPSYRKYGYIPSGDEHESVSKTLEYAYDDWCIATMAKDLGLEDVYKTYIKRAQSYKNIFDPQTGFMRAKENNLWFEPFDPKEVNYNYTEANCWQYSFYVPQDVNRLIEYLGGDEAFCARLDELFTTSSETTGREQADITGLIGQYAHGNEPSHHMAYLYSFAGQPHKTQQMSRKIMDELYFDAPDGLCGNEDCGQMSSWYVFSALGFYPVTPGTDTYVFGTPLFKEAKLNLENGNTFTVKAPNVSSKNIYIQEVLLNGKNYDKLYLRHQDIMAGGELEFVMGDQPSDFGTLPQQRPVTLIDNHLIVPVPFVQSGERAFFETTEIALGSVDPNVTIFYTLNGDDPDEQSMVYENPFTVNATTTVKAIAVTPEGKTSRIIESDFQKIPKNRKIKLYSEYANQYSAGGDMALVDFMRGGESYKTGVWQGYQGQHLRAVVDLGEITAFNTIETGFLQDENSWIFLPQQVEYYISEDGDNFEKVATLTPEIKPSDRGTFVEQFRTDGQYKAQYVKIVAFSLLENPQWHKSPGGKCWLFADEIVIE